MLPHIKLPDVLQYRGCCISCLPRLAAALRVSHVGVKFFAAEEAALNSGQIHGSGINSTGSNAKS